MTQLTYSREPGIAVAGMKDGIGPSTTETAVNNEAALPIPFGVGVMPDGANERTAKLFSGAAAVLLGVALHEHLEATSSTGSSGHPIDRPLPVMRKGRAWVVTEETIVLTDNVFIRHTANGAGKLQLGAFRKDVDGANARQVFGARWVEGCTGAGVALLEFDAITDKAAAQSIASAADAALRGDLINAANGKGASLVAMEGAAGTVQALLTTAAAQALAASAAMIQKRTVRIDKTTDVALIGGAAGGVKTITKNVGAILPANARFLGAVVRMAEVIDNVTNNATAALKVGGTDDDGIFAAIDVTTGGALVTAGYIKPNGAEAFDGRSLSAQQVVAVITATEDVNTLTQCDVSIDVFFFVLA